MTDHLTDAQLQEFLELDNVATRGPWTYWDDNGRLTQHCISCGTMPSGDFFLPDAGDHGNGENAIYTRADARLIATARTVGPQAAQELLEIRRRVENAKAVLLSSLQMSRETSWADILTLMGDAWRVLEYGEPGKVEKSP